MRAVTESCYSATPKRQGVTDAANAVVGGDFAVELKPERFVELDGGLHDVAGEKADGGGLVAAGAFDARGDEQLGEAAATSGRVDGEQHDGGHVGRKHRGVGGAGRT